MKVTMWRRAQALTEVLVGLYLMRCRPCVSHSRIEAASS
jgi:hypothetical protein